MMTFPEREPQQNHSPFRRLATAGMAALAMAGSGATANAGAAETPPAPIVEQSAPLPPTKLTHAPRRAELPKSEYVRLSATSGVKITRGIPVAPGTSIDIHRPVGIANKNAATIFTLPGGAWRGYVDNYLNEPGGKDVNTELAKGTGAVVVQVRYPLNGQPTPFSPALNGISKSIKWAQDRNRALGVSKCNFGLIGNSAGGHYALMEAMRRKDDCVKSVVAWAPVTNLAGMLDKPSSQPEQFRAGYADFANFIKSSVLGCDTSTCSSRVNKFSPVVQTSKINARNHATKYLLRTDRFDPIVPPKQSIEMHRALRANGISSRLSIRETSGHAFFFNQDKTGRLRVPMEIKFFRDTLQNKE